MKQLLRSWTTASLLWRKTVLDAEKTRKSVQRFAFWVHKEATIGMQGHGQLAARLSNVWPAKLRKRSDDLSTLYVMVRLVKAAKGNGSVAGEVSPVEMMPIGREK